MASRTEPARRSCFSGGNRRAHRFGPGSLPEDLHRPDHRVRGRAAVLELISNWSWPRSFTAVTAAMLTSAVAAPLTLTTNGNAADAALRAGVPSDARTAWSTRATKPARSSPGTRWRAERRRSTLAASRRARASRPRPTARATRRARSRRVRRVLHPAVRRRGRVDRTEVHRQAEPGAPVDHVERTLRGPARVDCDDDTSRGTGARSTAGRRHLEIARRRHRLRRHRLRRHRLRRRDRHRRDRHRRGGRSGRGDRRPRPRRARDGRRPRVDRAGRSGRGRRR